MEYFGSHSLSVDSKGRIVIPVAFREKLQQQCQGRLVIGQTFRTPCVTLYPPQEFERIRDELLSHRDGTQQFQNVLRILVGTAQECDLHSNGRVLVPKHLRQDNAIEKEAVLIGIGTRIELWDHREWRNNCDRISAEKEDTYQSILERLPI